MTVLPCAILSLLSNGVLAGLCLQISAIIQVRLGPTSSDNKLIPCREAWECVAGVLVCVADAAKLLAQAGTEAPASKQAACYLARRLLLWLASLPPQPGSGCISSTRLLRIMCTFSKESDEIQEPRREVGEGEGGGLEGVSCAHCYREAFALFEDFLSKPTVAASVNPV